MKYTEKQVSVPLCAVSTTSGLVNKTGTWKFAEPRFVDRISPCNQQCPAGEDITGYMYLAGQGKFDEALERLNSAKQKIKQEQKLEIELTYLEIQKERKFGRKQQNPSGNPETE